MLTINAKDSYELQLFATKSDSSQGIQSMLKRGSSAGLGCYVSKENRADGTYRLVRCDKTTNYNDIVKSIKKAKNAGLDHYLLKSNSKIQKSPNIAPAVVGKVVKIDDLSGLFFGNNEELMRILQNKNVISKSELNQRKAIYLKNIASSEKISGLSLRGNGANNFDIDRLAYNVRLQWDILDGGYIGSQKDVQKTLLRKELEYERIMDEYRQSNLELSLYKMNFISNYIKYSFLRQQEQILYEVIKKSQKKYEASLLTSNIFFKRKKAHDHIKQTLTYYEEMEKEQFDGRIKSFVSRIEYINIANRQSLVKHAYLNSFEIKNSQNKIKLSNIEENWMDRLKTNVYIEEKKIVYLNNSETVAGLQVQIPLDFNYDSSKAKNIEIKTNSLKAESLKRLIVKNIDDIYHKIAYHKSYIENLKSDIGLYENESKTLYLQSKFPLEKQTKDLQYESEMLKLTISKHNQKIWQERTEILKLLLKLQNISGVKILPV